MGLLTLSSTNPAFSFVLRKNPATTKLMVKAQGKGHLFGYYDQRDPTNQTFIVSFQEGANTVTYQQNINDTFEYLSTLRYTSPRFVMDACTNFFKEAMRATKPDIAAKAEPNASNDAINSKSPQSVLEFNVNGANFNQQTMDAIETSLKNKACGDRDCVFVAMADDGQRTAVIQAVQSAMVSLDTTDVSAKGEPSTSNDAINQKSPQSVLQFDLKGANFNHQTVDAIATSLKNMGAKLVYGDRDSLFVALADDGQRTAVIQAVQSTMVPPDATVGKMTDEIGAFEHKIVINLLHISSRAYKFFERFRKFVESDKLNSYQFDIASACKKTDVYRLTISTSHSLQHLLNTVFLLCAFVAAANRHVYLVTDKSLLERLIGIMNTMDAPYYIRYRFVTEFLDRSNFAQLAPLLTATPSRHFKEVLFHEGTTADHRRDLITSLLDFRRPILEVGCGEGFYTANFAQRLQRNKLPLVAIDPDVDVLKQNKNKCARKGTENVSFFESIESFVAAAAASNAENGASNTEYDVIVTEVVEHMKEDEATNLMRAVLRDVRFRQLIVTTPNAEFNPFYMMTTQYRHDDHKFEHTVEQFAAWTRNVLAPFGDKFMSTFIPVGDVVDGVHCSHGWIVKPKAV